MHFVSVDTYSKNNISNTNDVARKKRLIFRLETLDGYESKEI
jgi:hypothetical protein